MRQYLIERRDRDNHRLISQTLVWARDEAEALRNAGDLQPLSNLEYHRVALIQE
jgi:hypothetical protein